MDRELIHLMKILMGLDVTIFHPILSALEKAFCETFTDFRTIHYDTTFKFDDPIHGSTELTGVFALKLMQLLAFTRNKMIINAPDQDNPSLSPGLSVILMIGAALNLMHGEARTDHDILLR